ncbi:MAG: phosphomannomutase/phosphoglucomutase [Candidatus Aenigmarchaeota archaeon]|nr:phosphomannomutase/phosphoglucomutase [Candidatus Aenigmarchaeota archaeon]
MSVFRAYDIRGIYPEEINEDFAFKIGKAFGTFNPGKIVVGSELRLSSPSLKEELIRGLVSTGATVIDIGTVTSPILMFATRRLECDGGVNVSASHNPKEYNGFKFYYKDGIPIDFESGLIKIQEIFEKENFTEGKGKLIKKDVIEDYSNFLLSMVNIKKPINLKVVYDAGNGSTGRIYPKILRKAGIDVYELFCEPNARFPNHEPNPSRHENLVELRKKVLEVNADLGFASDGDGDRLAVVDEKGKIVYVGVIFSILIESALEKEPGSKIVYTALDSKAIEDVIRRHDGKPIVCRVGHTYITQKILEENAALAGEISGHYYFKETHGADDALFAILRIIEHLTKSGKRISDFMNEFPKYYSQVSEGLRVPVKESKKFQFIKKLKEEFKKKRYKIDTLDGVKVIFKDGWALFRPSNTEPMISMSYEATTKKGFERIKKFVENVINRIPR